MTAAGQDHQRVLWMAFEITRRTLRHTLVPEQLDIEEPVEGLILPVRVLFEYIPEAGLIGGIGTIDKLRNGGLFGFAEPSDANVAGFFGEFGGQVESDDRQLMLPCETQYRCIVPVIESPALVIFALTQQLPFAQLTADVGIEITLKRLLKGFHANGEAGIERMQSSDDFQLCQMVFVAVVGFTDEDDALIGQCGNDAFQVEGVIEIQRRCCIDRSRHWLLFNRVFVRLVRNRSGHGASATAGERQYHHSEQQIAGI